MIGLLANYSLPYNLLGILFHISFQLKKIQRIGTIHARYSTNQRAELCDRDLGFRIGIRPIQIAWRTSYLKINYRVNFPLLLLPTLYLMHNNQDTGTLKESHPPNQNQKRPWVDFGSFEPLRHGSQAVDIHSILLTISTIFLLSQRFSLTSITTQFDTHSRMTSHKIHYIKLVCKSW